MKLLSTIKEVQAQVPVLPTSNLNQVTPYLSSAERNYVQLVIGREQYAALVEAYEAAEKKVEQITDPVVREAVVISQRIISNLGYYAAIPLLNVNIGASGMTVFSNEDTKQAFKWQVDEVKYSLIELGFTAIEDLLIHLEESPDIFHLYIDSDQYRLNERFLIQQASVFSGAFNIGGSRYIFQMLSSLMKRVEDQTVKRLFGPVFFESLKLGELDEIHQQLVDDYLVPGIALLTGAKAMVERIITFKNGVASVNLEGNYGSEKNNVAATKEQITAAVDQLTADGSQFLQDGIDFLVNNALAFPSYIRQAPKRRYSVASDKDKGVFIP
jgi:hypothetical protein